MTQHRIILSPHFDDAVLSLGGLISKDGASCTVITLFAGAPEKRCTTLWDLLCGFANSDNAIATRSKENERALHFLGVPSSQIHNLSFVDKQYRSTGHKNLEENVVQEVLKLIQEARGNIELYAPARALHDDHALTQRVARNLVPRLGRNVRWFLYEDFPYALLARTAHSQLQATARPIPLSRDDLNKKVDAIGFYASQVTPLSFLSGGSLRRRVEAFARKRAEHYRVAAPYCEVVYEVVPGR